MRIYGLFLLKYSIILILFFYSAKCKAQESSAVTGRILDSAKHIGLPYATVYLIRQNQKEARIGIVTDSLGSYKLKGVQSGSYILKVEYIGYQSLKIKIDIDSTALNLAPIYLKADIQQLKEVGILAQNTVSQSIDRIIYHVDKDGSSKNLDVLNVMSKVPLLSVDGNDNIKYQGTSSFRILVNGKPSVAMDRNAKSILSALPASNVKDIEVITNPTGKFYQEGITGIINIITKKKRENGYEGMLYGQYRAPAFGPSSSASLSFKRNRFNASTYLSYSRQERPETNKSNESILTDPVRMNNIQTGSERQTTQNLNLATEVVYEVDTLNLITTRISFYHQNDDNTSDYNTKNTIFATMSELSQYRLLTGRSLKWNGFEASADYQHNFKKNKASYLTLSYFYNLSHDEQLSSSVFSQNINYTPVDLLQTNKFNQNEHTFQADYTTSHKNISIEAGIKEIMRFGTSNYLTSALPERSGSEDQYENDQYIAAGYAGLKYQNNKWGYKVATRFENAKIIGRFGNEQGTLTKTYNSFLPNLSLNYQFDAANNIVLTYQKSVRRPNISYLNPFVNQINPLEELSGNPDLVPVKINNINLQYRRLKKSSLILGFRYSHSNNNVQRVLIGQMSPGSYRFSYANIGQNSNLGMTTSYNLSVNQNASLNSSYSLSYSSLSGSVNNTIVENSGYVHEINLGLSVNLKGLVVLNCRYSYTSPYIELQGKTTTYPYYIFSGTKTLYQNKISVTASLYNPFQKYRVVITDYSFAGTKTTLTNQVFYRSAFLKVSYRFGGIKSQSRKGEKSVQNNDSLSIK